MTGITRSCSAILLTVAVVAFAATSVRTQETSSIKLFQLAKGGGVGQEIPVGTYRVNGKQLATGVKDPVFSVKIPTNYRVKFCDDDGQAGKPGGVCEEFDTGLHDLKSVNFTFIRVWVAASPASVSPATVYEGANWAGRIQTFAPGMYRADRNEFGKINNDMAMSAIVAKGYRVKFCTDEGRWGRGAGDCEEHEVGRYNLRFADSISFIEVTDLSVKALDDDAMPVILFEDADQGGKKQGFDVGIFLAGSGQFGKIFNDTASSISVKPGFSVMVCPDETPNDKCEELGAGKHNLKQKDSASYLRILKREK